MNNYQLSTWTSLAYTVWWITALVKSGAQYPSNLLTNTDFLIKSWTCSEIDIALYETKLTINWTESAILTIKQVA